MKEGVDGEGVGVFWDRLMKYGFEEGARKFSDLDKQIINCGVK